MKIEWIDPCSITDSLEFPAIFGHAGEAGEPARIARGGGLGIASRIAPQVCAITTGKVVRGKTITLARYYWGAGLNQRKIVLER